MDVKATGKRRAKMSSAVALGDSRRLACPVWGWLSGDSALQGVSWPSDEQRIEIHNRFHDPQQCSPDTRTLRESRARTDGFPLLACGRTSLGATRDFSPDCEEDGPQEASRACRILKGDGFAPPAIRHLRLVPRPPPATRHSRVRKRHWSYRWPDDIRGEVPGHLLKLNAERAQQEKLAGLAAALASPRRESHKMKSSVAISQVDSIPPSQTELL